MGRHLLSLLLMTVVLACAPAAIADDLGTLIIALGRGSFADREKAVTDIAAAGDPRAVAALDALNGGRLFVRKDDSAVLIGANAAGSAMIVLSDPLTGASQGSATEAELDRIRVNNRLRRVIESSLGTLTLLNPNPKIRRQAAEAVFKNRDPATIPILDQAIAAERIPDIKIAFERARAAAILRSDAAETDKHQAIAVIGAMGSRDALALLTQIRAETDAGLARAAAAEIRAIESSLAVWESLQNIWYGLSLGSVLLLAAIGLAITFGVMGVINMAHGEMVMIGAYTTFVVQDLIRSSAPGLFDYSLVIALPLAFLLAGAIGVLIERGIIRFLYGRSLETLLATWGLSLILQQTVRSIFGSTNREVGAPSWMAGAFEIGQMTITYGRLWIVVFAMIVFGLLFLLLRRTFFGLAMRAVTQNRAMAAAMGIRTPWIDAMTFGLGSGIAGIAGVALSQIDNVSPNLGQGYIIDSFMVVVFGGVGNLWGTLVGAVSLGIVNKFLEPYAGAVLGKILVLIAIILFIQKRPRGLFAMRGRAVEP